MFCDANLLFSPDLNSHHRLPYDVIRWVTNAHNMIYMYISIVLPIRIVRTSIARTKYYPILKPSSYVYCTLLLNASSRRFISRKQMSIADVIESPRLYVNYSTAASSAAAPRCTTSRAVTL